MLYKKTKRKKRKILKKYLIFFFVLCVALAAVFEYQVKPIQDNFIRTKGKVVVQKCISDAVTKTLEESTNEDFVNISTDGDGTVTAVNTDADSVNRFKSDLESEITASLEKIHTENISIPIGAFSGLTLLTEVGPNITFTYFLTGSFEAQITDSFESAGINQTLHQVELTVTGTVILAAYGYEEEIEVTTNYIISQAVIGGDVPQYSRYYGI